jgi:hypothetical protein
MITASLRACTTATKAWNTPGPTGTRYLEEIPGFFVAVVPSCRRDGAKRPVISEGNVTVAVVD